MPLNFIRQSAAHAADRIHILDLDLRPEFRLRFRANGNVAITAKLPLLHVGIANRAVNQDLFERGQKREGFLRGIDFGLRHDFHQRCAGTVEIDSRGRFKMKTFRHVFLEVNPDEMNFLVWSRDVLLRVSRIGEVVQGHAAIGAKRHIILRNLIILWHVRIEIVFPVEFTDRRNVAAKHETRERRHAQRFAIHYRQRAR